jgi:toxin ParE1/3/4
MRIVADYPYKIFYRLGDDAVDIVHIRHASRRPWA